MPGALPPVFANHPLAWVVAKRHDDRKGRHYYTRITGIRRSIVVTTLAVVMGWSGHYVMDHTILLCISDLATAHHLLPITYGI